MIDERVMDTVKQHAKKVTWQLEQDVKSTEQLGKSYTKQKHKLQPSEERKSLQKISVNKMTDKVIPVHMYLSNQASYTKISCQTISRNTFITEESCSRSFAYKCLLISMLSNICITNNILIPGYS
jgi:hypothetical protein